MSIRVHRYYVPDSLKNYNHLIITDNLAACVDPFNWSLAQSEAEAQGATLTEIWVTHGHGDHVAGVPNDFQGPIRGHRSVDRCQITHPIDHNDTIRFMDHSIQVLATPGHTWDHVCFYIPDAPALIAGDTLFNAGVGNTRSGDTDTLYKSIQLLKNLPGDTALYNGHDYMPTNVAFTESIMGETPETDRWREACDRTTPETRPVTTLAEEHALNLFFRTGDTTVCSALDLDVNAQDIDVFRALRGRRDQW